MWNLYATATTFHCQPSQLLRVNDEWAAFCLDSAISYFGNYVDGKLAETDSKGKPRYTIEKLLSNEPALSGVEALEAIGGEVRNFIRVHQVKA